MDGPEEEVEVVGYIAEFAEARAVFGIEVVGAFVEIELDRAEAGLGDEGEVLGWGEGLLSPQAGTDAGMD